MEGSYVSTDLTAQADALYFVREVHGEQMLTDRTSVDTRNATVDSFLRSFACSVLLSGSCVVLAAPHAWALLKSFDAFELLHLAYNLTVAFLFLIRTRPALVSLSPHHWAIALLTSTSGFFFVRTDSHPPIALVRTGDILIGAGVLVALTAALVLGRSFDLLPALRRVKTQYVYQIVRHPIYLSALVLRLGYVLKNPSPYNAVLLLFVAVLYDRRARYEEDILSRDRSYMEYLQQVRYRFVPGVY
jgi:protein-S-isoprenylcysteine O-methyltransferase Ste14